MKDFEVRLSKKDGTVMDCLLTATMRDDGAGNRHEVQGLVRDVTERKRAESTLLQQERDLAVLEERNRMAREIHDTLAQGFTGIVVQLEAMEQALDQSPAEAPSHLGRAKNLARESLQEARRSVWGLLPHSLEMRSLEDALREEVGQFDSAGKEKASFSFSGPTRELDANLQTALLRICQESLTNIRRHAGATEMRVELVFDLESVCLKVQDNGVGFNLAENTLHRDGGFGLIGMEQRASLLGGSLIVTSENGQGTVIEVRIPTAQGRRANGSSTRGEP